MCVGLATVTEEMHNKNDPVYCKYEYYSSLFPYVNAYVQYIPVDIPYRVTLIKDSKFERTYIGTSIYQYILYSIYQYKIADTENCCLSLYRFVASFLNLPGSDS